MFVSPKIHYQTNNHYYKLIVCVPPNSYIKPNARCDGNWSWALCGVIMA